jgi:SAM-dependent methyltransferase
MLGRAHGGALHEAAMSVDTMRRSATVEERLYPEVAAGGFARSDHRMAFLVRLHGVLEPHMRVLDLGAGRGKWAQDGARFRARLADLRGLCAQVVGADIDPAVLENRIVDERVVIGADGTLPFPDASFDVITAFSVLEHVENPGAFAREVTRVIRPGGWLLGWTPNRHGYVGVGARLVPRALHARMLRRLEPRRQEEDSFPPVYRLNDRGALRRHFPAREWDHLGYTYGGVPYYHGEWMGIARMWQALNAVLPAPWRPYHQVILRRR